MDTLEQLSITLPADMARLIRAKVQSGDYASNGEVVQEAIRAWQSQDRLRDERLAAIRRKIVEADADPRLSLTEEEVDRHFAARIRAHD